MSVQISSIAQIASSSAQTHSLRASFAAMTQAAASSAATGSAAPAAAGAQPTVQDLQGAADTLNEHFAGIRDDLHFTVAHDLGMPVISVVNANTGEVLWQIPSEQALEAARQASGSGHMLQIKA
jgi:flagellar protein FlaG